MMELLLSRSEAQGMVIKEDSTEGRDNECERDTSQSSSQRNDEAEILNGIGKREGDQDKQESQ